MVQWRDGKKVIGPGLSHLLSGERQLCTTKSLPPIAIPARFVFMEESGTRLERQQQA